MLSEIRPNHVRLFARAAVALGQSVSLALTAPESIYLKGKVVGCSFQGGETHVISSEPHPWRVSVMLEFGSEEERAQIEELCKRLKGPDSAAA